MLIRPWAHQQWGPVFALAVLALALPLGAYPQSSEKVISLQAPALLAPFRDDRQPEVQKRRFSIDVSQRPEITGAPAIPANSVAAGQIPLVPRVWLARTDHAPRIDGRLSEAVWRKAAVIDQLIQVEPVEGAKPTSPTEIRLLYDENFLYLGIRAYEDPDKIIARQLEQDGDLEGDDTISIIFDTFLDRRNAVLFEFNPRGAKRDGLIEGSGKPNIDWDGIWYLETSIDNQGWVAEFALPFKTVSFAANKTAWGFNIERVIRWRNESIRWAAATQDKGLRAIGDAGILENLVGLRQGLGLDFRPGAVVRYVDDLAEGAERTTLEPTADIFYRITPSLTAALTFNTDFGETEVDERQINLTRFDLFFPEKRDFFLQDAGIFDFGGIERNGRPFFSRRIGLNEDDQPTDLTAGAKLTGREGRFNLGFLDVQQDSKGELDSTNLFVSRVAVNVLEQSTAGIIITNGDPQSNDDNWLIGADFNYRNTDIFDEQVLTSNLWVQKSDTTGISDKQLAYGVRLDYPNDDIEAALGFTEIQKNFRPALGFANRRGIRQYDAEFRYRWRPQTWIRTVESGFSAQLVTDADTNETQTREISLNVLRIRNNPGDSIRFSTALQREVLTEEFEIMDDVIIPIDDYSFNRYGIALESALNRPFSGSVEFAWGDFFTGTRMELKPRVTWRPSPHLRMSVEYEYNDVDLPEGKFTTHLARGRFDIAFTPKLSWNNLVQYDNVSNFLSLNSRVRWTLLPGNEVFVVFNMGFVNEEEPGGFRSVFTETVGKLVWTFRY